MMKLASLVTVVLALTGSNVAHAQIAGVPRSIQYDAFMQQSIEDRLRTFTLITPGQRADIVKMHIERWIYVNRSWLTSEQLSVLEDFLYSVRPSLYGGAPEPDTIAKAKEMMTRTAALFSNAQIRQLTIYGDYIPSPPLIGPR
jgi:hypothetical protein